MVITDRREVVGLAPYVATCDCASVIISKGAGVGCWVPKKDSLVYVLGDWQCGMTGSDTLRPVFPGSPQDLGWALACGRPWVTIGWLNV